MHTQPVEDIDAVMGRFQAWAGSGTGSGSRPQVRELSCEEALQSRRYYWKACEGAHASAAAVNASDSATEPRAPQSASLRVKSRGAGHKPSAKTRARSHGVRPQARTAMSKVVESKSAVKSAAASANLRVRPTRFQDALAQAVHPAEVIVSSGSPAGVTRQVAISIRLADSERALIRTRAAESGVTVSAYVRQCALEVEQLRAEVQQTIRTMDHQATAPPPAQAGGVFARLFHKLFLHAARTLTV